MSSAIEKLTEEVLALPVESKKILADQLAVSLGEEADNAFRKNWATEAIRRRDEMREGRIQTIPGEEALAQVRQSISK